MTEKSAMVLEAAKSLTREERAEVAEKLLETLDADVELLEKSLGRLQNDES